MSTVKWCIGETIRDIEKKIILKCMKHFDGNKTKVAVSLDLSVRTIDNKLSLYKRQDAERKDS